MPKILIYDNWIFYIYDTDINENKPHVHVGKKSTKKWCKIWLSPVEISKAGDLTPKEQNEVLRITNEYQQQLLIQWDVFKAGKEVQIIKIK